MLVLGRVYLADVRWWVHKPRSVEVFFHVFWRVLTGAGDPQKLKPLWAGCCFLGGKGFHGPQNNSAIWEVCDFFDPCGKTPADLIAHSFFHGFFHYLAKTSLYMLDSFVANKSCKKLTTTLVIGDSKKNEKTNCPTHPLLDELLSQMLKTQILATQQHNSTGVWWCLPCSFTWFALRWHGM